MSMFGSDFQYLESALIAREKLQSVIAGNIANADTPNFHADRRSFADLLAEQRPGKNIDGMTTTHRMHISDTSDTHLSNNISAQHSTRSMDGNSVNVQKEMVRMSENQLMDELTLRLLKGKLTGMANAIREGSH